MDYSLLLFPIFPIVILAILFIAAIAYLITTRDLNVRQTKINGKFQEIMKEIEEEAKEEGQDAVDQLVALKDHYRNQRAKIMEQQSETHFQMKQGVEEDEQSASSDINDRLDATASDMQTGSYAINLVKGNHGIWLFVSKDGQTVFEQSGLKTIEEALQFALEAIKGEEERSELPAISEGSKWLNATKS